MKLSAIHPTFREALGIHEGFRRCGFSPDDIFWSLNPDPSYPAGTVTFGKPGTREMLVVLKTQGKEFAVTVGKVRMTHEEWEVSWKAVCVAVLERKVSEDDLRIVWESCMAYRDKVGFVVAISSKGIEVPGGPFPKSEGWN